MLESLELENFKAFGERVRIPFAPITLIFGENSAGKSSILQSLYLLKQTLESREAGALLLPRSKNGIVDLGSFQELIFKHDLERVFSIRVETKDKRELAIEFSFNRPSLEEDVRLNEIQIYYGVSSKCIAKFELLDVDASEDPEEFWRRMGFFRDPRGLPLSKLSAIKCVWLSKEPEYWKPEFDLCKEKNREILNQLEEKKLHAEELLGIEHEVGLEEEFHSLCSDITFYSSDFDLESYIAKRHSDEMNTVLKIQGFLPLMTEPRSFYAHRAYQISDLAQLVGEARNALEQVLESLFPMSPFRRPPERWYIFTGTRPQHVGYRGDLLPDLLFHHSELVTETNEWLKRLEMGYEIEVKPVGPDSRDLFEVRLIDTRGEELVNVGLPDVGFGISQLLPFVVQSLVSKQQIISIEQPEVHVHPRLQADLGDLLAEVIKEPRQNRFIIETHSEHLILRLQRLICEQLIKPEDVSVIYISRGAKGAISERLHLDEEGDFVDHWPNGFFPERLRELR